MTMTRKRERERDEKQKTDETVFAVFTVFSLEQVVDSLSPLLD
jgi:hypothetical protein